MKLPTLNSKIIWGVSLLAVSANYFIIQKSSIGYAIWMLTNTVLIAHNLKIKSTPQAFLFATHLIFATIGFIAWL